MGNALADFVKKGDLLLNIAIISGSGGSEPHVYVAHEPGAEAVDGMSQALVVGEVAGLAAGVLGDG